MRHLPALAAVLWILAPLGAHAQSDSMMARMRPPPPPDTTRVEVFGDSLEAGALMGAVLKLNPDIESGRQAWTAADARTRSVGSLPDPMVEYMVAPRTLAGADAMNVYRVGFKQRLPAFGTLGRREEVAAGEAGAAHAEYRGAALHAVHEARLAFIEYSLVDREQAIYTHLQGLLEEVHRTALSRYSVSTAGAQEALQTEVELGMLDHERFGLVRRRRQAIARINALLHRDPLASLPPPRQESAHPPKPNADFWLSTQAHERPEVTAATERLRAAQAGISLARRERLPGIELQAAYDRFMVEEKMRAMVGISLELPIHFGRLSAMEDEARANALMAESRLKSERDRAALEATDAATRVPDYWHELGVLDQVVLPTTERAYKATRARYETGSMEFVTLLGAARDLARMRLERERTLADYLTARADLEYATGQFPAGWKGE